MDWVNSESEQKVTKQTKASQMIKKWAQKENEKLRQNATTKCNRIYKCTCIMIKRYSNRYIKITK